MVTLNAEAAEFHPTNNHTLQQYSTHLPSLHVQYYYTFLLSSSYPLRKLNNPFFYYPTSTPVVTIPYTTPIPYYFRLPNQKQQYFTTLEEVEPTSIDNHLKDAASAAAHNDHEQNKEEVVVVAEKPHGPKSNMILTHKKKKDYALMRQAKEIAEEYEKCEPQRQRRFVKKRHNSNNYFRAFSRRRFPLIHVRPDGDETTVMIKNIPSKYTRDLLVGFLENHCKLENEKDGEGNTLAFDFVYLPMDFESGMNKGYAFVNFTNPSGARKFVQTASDRMWDLFQSDKIREVVLARIQGKEKLEAHFETMRFPSESEAVLPLWFSPPRDGIITEGNQRTMGNLVKNRRLYL